LEEQTHEKISGDKFKGNILVTQGDNDRTVGDKRAAEKKVKYGMVSTYEKSYI
jgi:hypothetical protein